MAKVNVLWFGFWLFLDCAGNVLLGGSFKRTLSATAWSVREHPRVGWIHRWIDAGAARWFGQIYHCKGAWEHENSPTFVSRWVEWQAAYRAA